MARNQKLRKKGKKRKPVGIRRPGGKFFSCRYCKQKKKTLHAMSQHYKDEHPHAIKKKKPREGLTQKQVRESLKFSTPADVETVDQLVAILTNIRDQRTFVDELLEQFYKRRRLRY